MRSFLQPLLIVLFFFVGACNAPLLKQEMVQFDRAFIPVFYYSYVGDVESAQKALPLLQRQWQKVRMDFEQASTASDDWQESIRLIGAWIEEAHCALRDGEAERALFQLDHARYELMDLRWREGINDYYLDYAWELEATIDIAISTSSDPMLKLLDWKEFVAISEDVNSSWQALQAQTVDQQLYRIKGAKMLLLKERQQAMNTAILNFLRSVESADRLEFAATAKALEPAYLNYINLFGDFESIQTFYASIQ
ncbi:MAG: hypothetical protein AAGG75_16555 [Bacteroidota bacterium]